MLNNGNTVQESASTDVNLPEIDNNGTKKLMLRPHHMYCLRFLDFDFPDRDEKFNMVVSEIRGALVRGTGIMVRLVEGTDYICEFCPSCQNNYCTSPYGDEQEVRKWDSILLRQLGLSYGDELSVEECRALINEKTPLDFCQNRCQWREICGVLDR